MAGIWATIEIIPILLVGRCSLGVLMTLTLVVVRLAQERSSKRSSALHDGRTRPPLVQ